MLQRILVILLVLGNTPAAKSQNTEYQSSKINYAVLSDSSEVGTSYAHYLVPEVEIRRTSFHKTNPKRQTSSSAYIKNLEAYAISPVSYIEGLNSLPGIFAHTGALNTNRITIRGIGSRTPYETNRIKAYFNGIPISSGDGSTEIEDFSQQDISSIEVLKGGKSALYGAGLGGVLQLTAQPIAKQTQLNSKTGLGSYNSFQQEISASTKLQNFGIRASATFAEAPGWRQNSHYSRQNFSLYSTLQFSSTTLELLVLGTQLEAHIPSSINEQDYTNAPHKAAANWLSAKGFEEYQKLNTGLSATISLSQNLELKTTLFSQHYTGYERRPFNILDDANIRYGTRSSLQYQNSATLLQVGVEWMQEQYNWKIFGIKDRQQQEQKQQFQELRTPLSIFLHSQYTASKWLLELGLSANRLDYSLSDEFAKQATKRDFSFDWELTPFVGASFSPTKQLTLFTAFSKGFSAPSVAETLPSNGQPNPQLQPETGWNLELGLRYQSPNNKLKLETTGYLIWLDNLLVTKRPSEEVFYTDNAGSTQHQGIELLANYWLLSPKHDFPIALYLSSHFLQAKFADFIDDGKDFSGNLLPGVPNQQHLLGLRVATPWGVQINLNTQHIGRQHLGDNNQEQAEAYTLLNLQLLYNTSLFQKQTKFGFSLNNLTDSRYPAMVLINAPSFGKKAPRYYYPGMPINWNMWWRISL